ncbi:hypothetical protein EH183_30555 [Streptomyces sp. CB01881]|nr:hypothetical protein C2142_30490 [Streptomyces sp. CB01881]TYC70829.1 hypothetical protein EH183_30555 [Streptomyces sp. CB01881]
MLIMVGAQSALEDIEGGVPAGQWHLVLAQTRYLVMVCCQAGGLRSGAEPYVAEDGGAIDPYTHVPAADWESGHRLISEAREFAAAAPSEERAGDWLRRVRSWVSEIEATLGLADPLPQLRSPEGMFGALRLVRGWHALADQLGLPPLLPTEWTKPL